MASTMAERPAAASQPPAKGAAASASVPVLRLVEPPIGLSDVEQELGARHERVAGLELLDRLFVAARAIERPPGLEQRLRPTDDRIGGSLGGGLACIYEEQQEGRGDHATGHHAIMIAEARGGCSRLWPRPRPRRTVAMIEPSLVPPERGVFCNRTLNLRSIRAIGYDMDYTLVHYREAEWERRAYEHVRGQFARLGWPVADLEFDPEKVIRGLILDIEQGNLVKANRFGFIKRAAHGTRFLSYDELRQAYQGVIVDLSEPRWVFLNTLFSLSEGCIYAQLVDRLDRGELPGPMGYRELYARVRDQLDGAHVEGQLKAEIVAHPETYVVLDEEAPLALLDQKTAGKRLALITNSEWGYTQAMMSYAFDRFLPAGTTWRELFDIVVVGARKPDFFTSGAPFLDVVTPDGLLSPTVGALKPGGAYFGGSASRLERSLGLSGDEILYVGDHMFGDVHVTKRVLRWRTALILRELEAEVRAIDGFRAGEGVLAERMREKTQLEAILDQARLRLQRRRAGYGPPVAESESALEALLGETRARLAALDADISPMAKAASELANREWGLLTRAGNDKSHLARQIERYADIYTSRVANLLHVTPFAYLRSPRGSLPHDPTVPGGVPTAPSPERT
jgi:HAD superfamily 5'-nucleotidase-like hydrolase